MRMHKTLLMTRVLKDTVLLLLTTGWLIGVSSLPLVWASDAVPGAPFTLDQIEEWATMPNRTMIVKAGDYEYLFSIEESHPARDCAQVQVDNNNLVWLTHIGYMPFKYITSTTPIMIRKVGAREWDSFVGKTWGPQCEKVSCGKKHKEKK